MAEPIKLTWRQKRAIKKANRKAISARIAEVNATATEKLAKSKQKARQASVRAGKQSSNPIIRKLAERSELKQAKHESDLRKIEASTKTAELSPQLALEKQRTEGRVQVAKAKTTSKLVGYTALAKGASTLGRGLIDEENRDDEKHIKAISDIVKDINGDSSDSGLKQGVE